MARALKPGIRVNIRGRSVKLRGLRRAPTGLFAWLAILEPGVISSAAGDDAGGIATNSTIGAQFGYELLWVLLILTVSLAVVQEMAARLGAATGRGLLDLVRERYGIGWALLAIAAILLANGGIVVSEFAGIAAAAELFGLSRFIAVPLSAAVIWFLMLYGSYSRVERLFLVMTLVFLTYPVAAILAHPDWGQVAHGAFVPSLRGDPQYLLLIVAMVGTTVTPYQQLFQQSAIVERRVPRRHYGSERADAYTGALFGNLIWAFIIIATGASLHVAGVTSISTAADAAEALRPIAGQFAGELFAVGLLGASLLAASVVPVATAYSVSEAFGFRKGVSLIYRRAPIFYGLFTVLVLFGSAVALVPAIPLVPLLVGVQVLNGLLLPVTLLFILLLANDRALMGELRNGRVYNVLGWGTFVLVTVADVVLLATQALGLSS